MPCGTSLPPNRLLLELSFSEACSGAQQPLKRPTSCTCGLAAEFVSIAIQRSSSNVLSTASANWTYENLLIASNAIARRLKSDNHFVQGSRVVLLLPNSIEYVAAFYGTLMAGGVVVPLPPTTEKQTLDRILASTDAVSIIISSGVKRAPLGLGITETRQESLRDFSEADVVAPIELAMAALDELAVILFTSGSTGEPKGVMLSHRNLISNAQSIQQYLQISESDKPLCVVPFYHAFGNSVLQSHVLAGATLVLDGKTMFPETVVAAIEKHHATSLSAVPDMVRYLLERTSLGRTRFPSLKYVAVAGGPLPYERAMELSERIAPSRLYAMYGQTEATARLAYVPPDDLARLPEGCLGKAIPGVELEVVDDAGNQVAIGEVGELRARGPNIMQGYWQDSETTAERLRDGWLLTGDLAVADADGWLYHRGRRNSIVKIAGFRVHPGDLETFAIRRLSVVQAVAVPFESSKVGTRLALFVGQSTNGEISESEMLSRCRAELPRHLAPAFVRHVDEFPLNSAMKVDRQLLSKIAENHHNSLLSGDNSQFSISG